MSIKNENISSSDISSIITTSLYGDKALFVLSAHNRAEYLSVQDLLAKTWQSARDKRTTLPVRNLSTIHLSLPWSEHPTHALFTSIFELQDLDAWKTMLVNALRDGNSRNVTTNTHIAEVLEGMAHPVRLGTHEFMSKGSLGMLEELLPQLLRKYLLDLTPPVADRSKLRLARALTTQDRYELLRCLWQCEMGLTPDLDVQKHTRIWIFLDEAENVLDYAPTERKMLAKGLAHIISQTGHFLTLWLNIADRETVPAVKKAFGDLLWQWLDHDFTDDTRIVDATKGTTRG